MIDPRLILEIFFGVWFLLLSIKYFSLVFRFDFLVQAYKFNNSKFDEDLNKNIINIIDNFWSFLCK